MKIISMFTQIRACTLAKNICYVFDGPYGFKVVGVKNCNYAKLFCIINYIIGIMNGLN